MGKLILITITFLLSLNVIAASNVSNHLDSAISKALHEKTSTNIAKKNTFNMIYGGQDISKPLVATADESLWAGHNLLVG